MGMEHDFYNKLHSQGKCIEVEWAVSSHVHLCVK